MPNELEELAEGPASKSQVESKMQVLPIPVAPYKYSPQQNMVKKAKEEKRRELYAEIAGPPLSWLPYFCKLGKVEEENEQEGAMVTSLLKGHSPFGNPEPQMKLEDWKARFGVKTKDKSTQTDVAKRECIICMRNEYQRLYGRINLTSPSTAVDLSRLNEKTRDIGVECPDCTYYDSRQLVFMCIGKMVYRGWTYDTLDGMIAYMPRFPRGIPINELRVEKPLRTPGPR